MKKSFKQVRLLTLIFYLYLGVYNGQRYHNPKRSKGQHHSCIFIANSFDHFIYQKSKLPQRVKKL